MSEFISELKAAWIGNRRRKFHQSTRGIMTPEERRALEEDFDRQLAERDRQIAEKAWDEGRQAEDDAFGRMLAENTGYEELKNPYGLTAEQERDEQ